MSKPTNHRNALPIGHQLQEYRLESLLGHGGFGITYLAHDTELDAAVAIKEYLPNELGVREADLSVQPKSPQDADDFAWGLERFIQEARTLARFNHPNIVRVRRFFRAHNTAYIVMDYEQGRSLAAVLKEGETAEEAELMSLLPPLLDGLKTVHDAGYLHRDIKPGNIYLRDKDNSPVLIDFGAARYDVGSRSRSVTTIVSPGYSPFEQYQTKSNQGPWTDIYALGAVLYRTIGGKTPVESTERIDAIIYNKPDPLKPAVELGQHRYSKRLLEGIDYALQARETERPQNVTKLKTAILLPSQRQPPLPSKQKSSGFKRAAVFVFVVMLVAVIGLVGYGHWQQWRLEQIAEQLKEKQR
jgi:serine/threonine protein kinase